jgi:hypothetical protein
MDGLDRSSPAFVGCFGIRPYQGADNARAAPRIAALDVRVAVGSGSSQRLGDEESRYRPINEGNASISRRWTCRSAASASQRRDGPGCLGAPALPVWGAPDRTGALQPGQRLLGHRRGNRGSIVGRDPVRHAWSYECSDRRPYRRLAGASRPPGSRTRVACPRDSAGIPTAPNRGSKRRLCASKAPATPPSRWGPDDRYRTDRWPHSVLRSARSGGRRAPIQRAGGCSRQQALRPVAGLRGCHLIGGIGRGDPALSPLFEDTPPGAFCARLPGGPRPWRCSRRRSRRLASRAPSR